MFSKLSFFITILFVLFLFSTAQAATFTVTLGGDTNNGACGQFCTLRDALNAANANGAGADTINFNLNPAVTTIQPFSPLPTIATSLTINGTTQPGYTNQPIIVIDGNGVGSSDGLIVTNGANNATLDVTIQGLAIMRFPGSGIRSTCTTSVCNVTIKGNRIGTTASGQLAMPNQQHGIYILASPNSTFNIGGTGANEGNVISANGANGINLNPAANTTVNIYGNTIGLNASGTTDFGNAEDGINVGFLNQPNQMTVNIGGTNPAARNVISGNDKHGIEISGQTTGIYGNYIGTDASGTNDLGNTDNGIDIGSNATVTVGGTFFNQSGGNVISGNNGSGIAINSTDLPAPVLIKRNRIGTNAAGTSAVGNTFDGISIGGSPAAPLAHVIGSDTSAFDANTISGNGDDGISIGSGNSDVKVYGNVIGTNGSATLKVPNLGNGIAVQGGAQHIGIAGNAIAANTISGNAKNGVHLYNTSTNGTEIYNNYIGTNSAGASNLGNTQNGVLIGYPNIDTQTPSNNKVGGSQSADMGNQIAFNGGDGVNVLYGTNNRIQSNIIYSNGNLAIDLGTDGVSPNDPFDTDTGANDLQNFPVLLNASPSQLYGKLTSIPSTPGTQYAVDFYRVDSCDASGYGEGRYYITRRIVTVPASGTATFNYLDIPLTAGQIITATATVGTGSTSEFSQCLTVTPSPGTLALSSATYTANEAGGTKTIVVNRAGGSFGTVQVNYETIDGTATAGQDYTAASGTLTFLNGETIKSFDIPITNDAIDEIDETINIALSNPTNGAYLVYPNTAILTITDNDNPPTVSIDDNAQFEGNLGTNPYSFRVFLSGQSSFPVTVDYTTANGTATASSDYAFTSGQVTFQPGETLKSIPVTVIGDLTPELDETFFVNLSNPVNATFGDNQGLGTIKDDDSPGKFAFAFAPYSGTEHDSVLVTVNRTNGTAGTISVDYQTSGGTATAGVDYTPASGTLIFGDGETTKTFNVGLGDDQVPEPAETINLVLSNPIGGATLGAPAIAVLNIIDNDSGTLLTLGGQVKLASNNAPLANVTMTLQGAANQTTTTDAQGRYSFGNLAPNSNYTVTPSALGYTFNPISQQFNNLTADNLNVNFQATAAPSRQLRIVGGNATPGQNVTANIELVAQGDENSVGFSLNYDSAILTNPQVVLAADAGGGFLTVNNSTGGKLGILVALQAGQNFAVGTKQIVTVTFNTLPTNAYNSPVTFGDVPITKQVVNTNADALPTNFLDGAVTFAQGYESDVAPRPTGSGNGSITVTDFSQIGKFVAGIDQMNAIYNEFQRADSAPRVSLGNGVLTVADYTQAGRYAAGLDPATPTGGQASANRFVFDRKGKLTGESFDLFKNLSGLKELSEGETPNAAQTVVRVAPAQAHAGQQVVVSIETDAQGTENGFGFTLNYDSAKLSSPLVLSGAGVPVGSTLIPNTLQAGKVGVVLGLPFGQAMAAGTRQLVTVRFNVAPNASGGDTPLTFADAPVFREVSDVDANVLQSNFQSGAINILSPTAADASIGGRVSTRGGRAISGVQISLVGESGAVRFTTTDFTGNYHFDDVPSGETYTVRVSHKRYRFNPAAQTLTILEDAPEVNFVSLN